MDSIPDLSHIDQLTFVFRFVSEEGKTTERFIGFEPIKSYTGESLAGTVLAMLDSSIDIANCRGQSYDNASNMSGRYNGLQAHLKERNPLIHYIPCAAHSLNLVGANTIDDSCEDARSFFKLMQSLYAFCAGSTHRWSTFFNDEDIKIDMTLKSLSSTHWSCRADASKALCGNYAQIRDILRNMSSDMDEKRDTRDEAKALCSKLGSLDMALMAEFWNCVLSRFKITSVSLQRPDNDLMTAIRLLESLRSWVISLREKFDHFESSAKSIPGVCQSYQDELQRSKKRNAFSDECTEHEITLNGRERFKVSTFNVIVDKLISCLGHRMDAYRSICDKFRVLLNLGSEDLSSVREQAVELRTSYQSDLDENFTDEMIQFRCFMQSEQDKSPQNLLQVLLKCSLQSTIPNVFVALRIFLTLPVTNCEGERSFSQLARIKNELRTTQTQGRLCALSLMAIESELVRDLDFDEIVTEFANRRARKKPF